MKEQIWEQIIAVKQNSPLVHNITNYVVMNNTANALLAAGASPIMAHAHAEITDMVNLAGALVINIGTLDEYWVQSMLIAAEHANAIGKHWVLDPVGAGATPYRNEVLKQLLKLNPAVIRANASEIMALARQSNSTKGVDSVHQSNDAVSAAVLLNQEFGSVICISGATDIIIKDDNTARLSNGHHLMAKVTGLGCTATALTGAFVAVNPHDTFLGTAAAMALLGVCGEIAASISAGPGSLQVNLLDTLYSLTEEQFFNTLKIN